MTQQGSVPIVPIAAKIHEAVGIYSQRVWTGSSTAKVGQPRSSKSDVNRRPYVPEFSGSEGKAGSATLNSFPIIGRVNAPDYLQSGGICGDTTDMRP